MRSRTLMLTIVAAGVALGGIVSAQPRRQAQPQAPGPRKPMAALGLTEEQQQKMKTIRLAQAKEMAQLKANLQVAQLELREALGQTNPAAAAVKAKVAAVSKAKSAIFEKQIDARLNLSQILTPEQRTKAKALKQGAKGRRGKAMRGGHRGMRGRPGAMRGERMGMRGDRRGMRGEPGKMQGAPQAGPRNPMAALGLTEEQQQKMKAIRLAQAKEMAQLKANLQVAQIELKDALGQDTPNAAAVKAKAAAVSKARSVIFAKHIDARLNLSQVLTPEQRQKMQELKQTRGPRGAGKGMRGGRRGMMGGRGRMQGGPGPFCPWGAAPPQPEPQQQ